MKNMIVLALVAGLAGFIGFSVHPSGQDPDGARFRELRTELEKLGKVDVEEYLRLKDAKARYEKADEIMGKILMLMLYDLGLKESAGQIARLKNQIADAPAAPPSGPSGAADVPVNGTTEPRRTIVAQPGSVPGPVRKADWKQNGAKVVEVYRADQVEDFLKTVEIPDFFGALRTGSPLNETQLAQLNGTFGGRAIFEDVKSVPWDVQLYLNAQTDGGEVFGEFEVRLRKNGKQFSRTTSGRKRGQKSAIKLDNLMGVDGDGQSFIINAYGDDGYFQLYFFPRLNEFHGLVYLKKSIGVFERRGVVHLTKI